MSGKRLQLKRGTTTQTSTFTGLDGEVTVDTTKKTLVVHDGSTVGGTVLAKDSALNSHTARTDNPHAVTKAQVGLSNVDNTADADKVVASAGKLTTTRTISLSGDATGSVNFDGSANADIVVTVGNDTHTHAFSNLTEKPTTVSGYGLTDVYTKTESNTSLALKVNNSEKGVANGVSTLDANGKVVLTQIPDSVLGQLEYMGVHNFTTMPTATQKGQYWIASVSGNGYIVGDWAVWNGTAFDKVDNTDAVATVAGRTGNVVLTKSDVELSNADNTSDVNKPISTAQQTALNLKANLANPTFTGTVTAPTFSGALTGTATTANALNTANSYIGAWFTATGGALRAQNWGGIASNGVTYYGNANSCIYKEGVSWLFNNDQSGYLNYLNTNGNIVTANGGTWSINASSASALIGDETNWTAYRSRSVANMLSWKNYGNGHCIFDASNSTTPNGVAVNNTNPQNPWSPTFPTLMGWNGGQTYGVRVDSARYSDNAATATTAADSSKLIGRNWYWSGQGGQPVWLWGGSDGTNMYVYNPSNFNVNYANSAGYATTASALSGVVGSAPSYACRAWVNFNSIGTVAIRASGNVSSITDNGVGAYTVNFTTAMQDANYSTTGNVSSAHHKPTLGDGIHSTTQLSVTTGIINVSYNTDISIIEIQVFR